jgi:hypothetical protein
MVSRTNKGKWCCASVAFKIVSGSTHSMLVSSRILIMWLLVPFMTLLLLPFLFLFLCFLFLCFFFNIH